MPLSVITDDIILIETESDPELIEIATAGPQGPAGASGMSSIVPGNNIDIDVTDPLNPIVSVETLTLADISDITASAVELNYVDGVTSAVQTQLDTKVKSTAGALTANAVVLGAGTTDTKVGGAATHAGSLTIAGNIVQDGVSKIIGGTGTTSDLTLQTTSGVGASGADFHLLVGNNGATEALTVLNSGDVGIRNTAPGAALDVVSNSGADGIWIRTNAGVIKFIMGTDGGGNGRFRMISSGPERVNVLTNGLTYFGGGDVRIGMPDAAAPSATGALEGMGSRTGTDTNVAGASLTIRPGKGTGNATPGALILQSYVAVASGTGAQTATTTLTLNSGRVGVGGTTSPIAMLHLPAGTATASTAPLKFTSGTLLTSPEAGAIEYLTDDYYATIATGNARRTFAFAEKANTWTADQTLTANLIFDGTRKIIGGTGTTSDLTLQTTSGVGAAGADFHLLVGNNGATEAVTVLNSGNVGINKTAPTQPLHLIGDTDANAIGPILVQSTNGGQQIGTALTLDATALTGGKTFSFLSTGNNAFVGAGKFSVFTPGAYLFLVDSNAQYIAGINKTTFAAQISSYPYQASTVGLAIIGAASQSANFLNVTANGGTAGAIFNINSVGNAGLGTASQTAALHIKAGTATASTAPLKFTSGTLLTSPEAGAIEFLTDDYYATIATGAARKTLAWIPAQTNQTASRALNTTYTNTGNRSLMVHATMRCAITLAAGNAYVQAKSDSSTPPTTIASGKVGIESGLLGEDNTFQIFFVVAPGMKYRVDSSATNGSVTLGEFFEVSN